MTFDQFLTLFIIVGGMAGILIFGILRMVKAQKSGGTIDQEEQIELLEFFRSRILELVKVALELQRLNKIGEGEVTDYVIEKVYREIQASTVLNDTEKAIISVELVAKFIEMMSDEFAKVVEDFNAEDAPDEVEETPEEDNLTATTSPVTGDDNTVSSVWQGSYEAPVELSDLVHRGPEAEAVTLSHILVEAAEADAPSVETLEIPAETETIELVEEATEEVVVEETLEIPADTETYDVVEEVEAIEETVTEVVEEVAPIVEPEVVVDEPTEEVENIAETMNDDFEDITPVSEDEKNILG